MSLTINSSAIREKEPSPLDPGIPLPRFRKKHISARPAFHIVLTPNMDQAIHGINIQRLSSFPSTATQSLFQPITENVPLRLSSLRRLSSRYCCRVTPDTPQSNRSKTI